MCSVCTAHIIIYYKRYVFMDLYLWSNKCIILNNQGETKLKVSSIINNINIIIVENNLLKQSNTKLIDGQNIYLVKYKSDEIFCRIDGKEKLFLWPKILTLN